MATQLFIDKYAPESFSQIKFNHEVGKQLAQCAYDENLPHIINDLKASRIFQKKLRRFDIGLIFQIPGNSLIEALIEGPLFFPS